MKSHWHQEKERIDAIRSLKARIETARGEFDRAERHLRDALRLRPDYRDALVPLAALLATQQRWVEAEASWRNILKIDPDNTDARRGLAAAELARTGRR